MKPIKLGEGIDYKDPCTNQVRVGMIISLDEDTTIVWPGDRSL